MRPHYLPNSFVKELFDQENAKEIIKPIIPHHLLYSDNAGNDDRDDKGYWTLRQCNSLTKIQKMKEDKTNGEIDSMRIRPDINSKSKRIIEEEYKQMDVLKRMGMIQKKADIKVMKKRSMEQKMNDMKVKEEKVKNSNVQYSMIKSRYKNPIKLMTTQSLSKTNTNISNSNSHFLSTNNKYYPPKQTNRLTKHNSAYNLPINAITPAIHYNKIDCSFRTTNKRKEDLSSLISFMNQCNSYN